MARKELTKQELFYEVCATLTDYEQEDKFDTKTWYDLLVEVWRHLEMEV